MDIQQQQQQQQQQHQRSPSFVEVTLAKPSTVKKNSPLKSHKKFKAVPSIQLLQSLNMYSPSEQPSTKKLNFKAVRRTELNLEEFAKPTAITTNNRARKQLWSVNKNDKSIEKSDRKRSLIKPNVKKMVFSRPSSSTVTAKKNTPAPESSEDPPLMKMDQFTMTAIKRTLFPAPQIGQRRTSHISVLNKKQTGSSLAKKLAKPKIVITPAEEKTNKKSQTTSSNSSKSKQIEKDKTVELLFQKIAGLEEKLKAFDDVKKMLKDICVRLDIEVPENISPKETVKLIENNIPTTAATATTNIPNNNNNNNNKKMNNDDSLLTPLVSKLSLDTSELHHPSKASFEPDSEIFELSIKSEKTPKIQTNKPNQTESTMKLKKTWITQFEQIENKLLNNPNISLNLNSSPDDSPVPVLHLNDIVNSTADNTKLKIKKSQSTSNLADASLSNYQQRKVLFKNKETDLLTESICIYNELRDEMKFLSTPVNNKTTNFMTPSVQGNEKKMISRRVQEQLLRLNDCL